MQINSTIFFTIASFFYSSLLMLAFFSKEKIKTEENKIYSKLIIINFIGIILELLCAIFSKNIESFLPLYTILNKAYLIYLIVWCSVFGIYVFLISISNTNKLILCIL